MNIKDCAEITTDIKYIRKISSIRYRLNINNITSLKGEHKGHTEIILDHKALDRI